MAATEIEIAGRRAFLDLTPEEAARARALARRLERVAAGFQEEPDQTAFFARLALALASQIDEATARVEALERGLRPAE
jgi:hypothetical protein